MSTDLATLREEVSAAVRRGEMSVAEGRNRLARAERLDIWNHRHAYVRPYNANALIPGAEPSILDPRD